MSPTPITICVLIALAIAAVFVLMPSSTWHQQQLKCLSSHTAMVQRPVMMGRQMSMTTALTNVCDKWEVASHE